MINESISPDKFDWDLYEGWDGTTLRENKAVKKHKDDLNTIVYCHEPYAQEAYEAYYAYDHGKPAPVTDLKPNGLYGVEDIKAYGSTVVVTLMGGAIDVEVDLSKEGRYFDVYAQMYGVKYDRESFMEMCKDPYQKQGFLGAGVNVKMNSNKTKASLWDGYVAAFENELFTQTKIQNAAYIAHVDVATSSGYFVTVNSCVKAFMPGSMAAINKVTDFEALVGKDLYVVPMNYDERHGFVVSHKKYLQLILPARLEEFKQSLQSDPDKWIEGTVTGSTKFGVFIEIDDILTGMIHYTLFSKELKKKVEEHAINPGDKINVRVEKFEGTRIVLTDQEPKVDVSKLEQKFNTKEQ